MQSIHETYGDFFLNKYGPFTVVRKDAVIVNGASLAPFVVIGTDGFGFETEGDSGQTTRPVYKIPLMRKDHEYPVYISEDVEIGPFVNIDSGSWRMTEIGKGTKIDSHVKIAHNVVIGKNVKIVAGTVIGGSVTIEDGCFIGINAGIKQRISIGENAFIGMGAVVVKDVPANTTVKGNPAS